MQMKNDTKKEKTSTTSKIVDGGGKRRRKDGGYRRDDADDGTTQRPASLARAVRYCHDHRVRVYVAFNTLVFDDELREVEGLIGKVWDCGVDAVIVQDVGVSRIVKEVVDRWRYTRLRSRPSRARTGWLSRPRGRTPPAW